MFDFFVSCPLGFEFYLIQELESFWSLLIDLDGLPTRHNVPEFESVKGGVEFSAPYHLGVQLNFFTRLGLRILCRIGHFKARYFDQFEKEFKKIKFDKYLPTSTPINFQIESSKSRLFHEKNLSEVLTQVLSKSWTIHAQAEHTVFIRVYNDVVTVSLDTSGDHLHFRGYRQQQGAAPLRENLAALIYHVFGLHKKNNLQIIDPFCGSGTLLFEGVLLKYPHFHRQYAFQKFVHTPALFKSDSWMKNYRWFRPSSWNFIGLEKDPKTYEKALYNANMFQKIICPTQIHFLNTDSEYVDVNKLPMLANIETWLITNPPYGERLESENVPSILQRFENIANLTGIIVLHPASWQWKFSTLRLSQQIPFMNQGLKLNLSLFSKAE